MFFLINKKEWALIWMKKETDDPFFFFEKDERGKIGRQLGKVVGSADQKEDQWPAVIIY